MAATPPRTPYVILVTGSRDMDPAHVVGRLWQAVAAAPQHRPILLRHGDCPTGVDRFTRTWARHYGFAEEGVPADWGTGRKAGPERNRRMVDMGADMCLAIIGPCVSKTCRVSREHLSHGASGCADMARRAGIPTELHEIWSQS